MIHVLDSFVYEDNKRCEVLVYDDEKDRVFKLIRKIETRYD